MRRNCSPAILRCAAAVLCFAIAGAAAQQDEFDRVAAEAQRAFQARDFSAAARAYARLAELRPDSPEILNNLGVSYHFAGESARAVEILERVLRLSPDLFSANLLVGMNYIRLDRPQLAIAPLTRALARDPQNRDALLALASAHFALHDFAPAVDAYLREVRHRPDDADAWYAMALCLESLAEDAARLLAKAGRESVYHNRLVGDYLLEQDPSIDAEQAFRRAIAAATPAELPGLHARTAIAHLRLGELEKARQEAAAELRLHPRNPEGELAAAAVAVEQGEFSEGVRRLAQLHTVEPGYLLAQLPALSLYWSEKARAGLLGHLKAAGQGTPLAPLLISALSAPETLPAPDGAFIPGPLAASANPLREAARLCRGGRYVAAFEAAGIAVKKAPEAPPALYWRSESARKLAKLAFQKAVQLKPDSWQAQLLLGDIYRQRSEWDLAASHYRAAAKLNPAIPAAQLGLATIEWQNGRFDEAEPMLRKVLELDPENAQANLQLGDICVRQHRFEEAIAHLKKTIARYPEMLLAHADLGKAYASLDQLPEAETELERALPMDLFGNLHYQLSVVYRRAGKTELAAGMLERSRKIKASRLAEHEQRRARYLGAAAENPPEK